MINSLTKEIAVTSLDSNTLAFGSLGAFVKHLKRKHERAAKC
jgi:hypothetical protein